MENIIDCPALHEKSKLYPFGDKVPKKIQMLTTVNSDPLPFIDFVNKKNKKPPEAKYNETYLCWTNKHGAVAVVIEGERLGVKPDEFKIVEWH